MRSDIDLEWTAARRILRVAAQRCQRRLFVTTTAGSVDFERRLTMCIAEMGYGVCDVILQWYTQTLPDAQRGDQAVSLAKTLSDTLNVFFWPGYQSKLLESRLVLRGADGEPKGIGIRPDRLLGHWPRAYEVHPTTGLFKHTLQPWQAGFQPGSTHEWIRKVIGVDPVDGSARDDERRLAVLEVTRLEELAFQRPDDWVTIRVPDNKERRWAQTIRQELAKVIPLPWPSPYAGDATDDVRLALYNIWLAGTFGRPILTTPALFNDLETAVHAAGNPGELDGLVEHLRRVQHLDYPNWAEQQAGAAPFVSWYTIAIAPPVSSPRADIAEAAEHELGSAMILTSIELPSWLIQVIQDWIVSIYLALREAENIELRRYAGRSEMIGAFSHEAGNIGTHVTSTWTKPLAEIAVIEQVPDDEWTYDPATFLRVLCPTSHVDAVKRWTVCPVPTAQDGLRDILIAWGHPRAVTSMLGLGDRAEVELGELIRLIGERARGAAAARRRLNDAFPTKLSGAAAFDSTIATTAANLATVVVAPGGARCGVRLVGLSEGSFESVSFFVRILFAILTNTLIHAQNRSVARLSLHSIDDAVRVRLTNVSGGYVSPKAPNHFAMSTFEVARYCLSQIRGNLVAEPPNDAANGAEVITEFEIPYPRTGVAKEMEWLIERPSTNSLS